MDKGGIDMSDFLKYILGGYHDDEHDHHHRYGHHDHHHHDHHHHDHHHHDHNHDYYEDPRLYRYEEPRVSPTKSRMIICERCGVSNDISHKFCYECGNKLQKTPIACPKCNTPVMENVRFCPQCGTQIR